MTPRLLGPDGRPVRKPEINVIFDKTDQPPEPVRNRAKVNHEPEAEPDLLERCEWIGPLGIYQRAAGLWLIIHAVSGEVIGGGGSRNVVLGLIRNLHKGEEERARRREERADNYDRKIKKGTW
jgi:hypothetical protein